MKAFEKGKQATCRQKTSKTAMYRFKLSRGDAYNTEVQVHKLWVQTLIPHQPLSPNSF